MQEQNTPSPSPGRDAQATNHGPSSSAFPGTAVKAKGGAGTNGPSAVPDRGPGNVTTHRRLPVGSFDNYCEAINGGALWVIVCEWPDRPEASFAEQFRGLPKWFVLRWDAFLTCRQLEEAATSAIAAAAERPRYRVAPLNPKLLGRPESSTGAAGGKPA